MKKSIQNSKEGILFKNVVLFLIQIHFILLLSLLLFNKPN
jgi:hypothetical protein